MRRWAEHFSKSSEVLIISDSDGMAPGARVEKVFQAGAGVRNLARVPRMRRLVRQFKPDIVHGHYLAVGGFYAALSGGVRVVGSAGGPEVLQSPQRSVIERSILRYSLKRFDLVFAGTKEMAENVRALGYRGEIALFRFGVDPSVFRRYSSRGPGEFRILSIRPCSERYNPHTILEAFKLALPHIGNSYLYLFDHGSSAAEIRRSVEQDARLRDHVRFVPKVAYQDMPDYYNMGDLAVSVPNSDSAAASVLEAMACEVPVVACDIPSMREWIEDGVDGYLTAVDPHKLAEKLRKAYSVRAMLAAMGRRARAVVMDEKNQGTFESNMKVAESAYKRLIESIA
jgi:glycosyltransferase involved in cell wall biosynthesis